MSWKDILKNEEELPEHVKRARERVKRGLPSIEQPLIPQFDDEKIDEIEKRNKTKDGLTFDRAAYKIYRDNKNRFPALTNTLINFRQKHNLDLITSVYIRNVIGRLIQQKRKAAQQKLQEKPKETPKDTPIEQQRKVSRSKPSREDDFADIANRPSVL